MRRSFLPRTERPAIENANNGGVDLPGVISLEEEQMLIEETAEHAAEVSQDLAEAERVLDISDALEDLAVVADQIQEATPTEIALIQTVGDVATAGSTQVTSEEVVPLQSDAVDGVAVAIAETGETVITTTPAEGEPVVTTSDVPATESFKGRRIAIESILERARLLWERVQKMLAQIWEAITSFFYKNFAQIPRLRAKIGELRTKVEELKDRKPGDVKTIRPAVGSVLNVAGHAVKNGAQLESALADTSAAVKYVFETYVSWVASCGTSVAKVIQDFKPAESHDAAKRAVDALMSHKPPMPPGLGGGDNGRHPNYETIMADSLLGNRSLASRMLNITVFQRPRDSDGDGSSVLAMLTLVRHVGITWEVSNEKAVPLTDVELDVLTPSQMTSILNTLDKLLDQLEAYHRGAKGKELEKGRKALADASAKATTAMESAKDGAGEATPYYRALLNLNLAYTKWSEEPAVAMMRSTLQVVRACMVVVATSAATYK